MASTYDRTLTSIFNFCRSLVSTFLMYFQGKQKEAEQARLRFAGDTRSDHLALLKAFQVNVYRYLQTQVESFFALFKTTYILKEATMH